ncbi:MAG: hypothetical protein WBA22_03915 [Candidatus Methanofastidiosia archaeon]
MTSQFREYKYRKRVFVGWFAIVLALLALSFIFFLEERFIVSVGFSSLLSTGWQRRFMDSERMSLLPRMKR